MKRAFFDRVVRLVLLPLSVSCAAWASAQPAADAPTTHVFRLKHVAVGFSPFVAARGITGDPRAQPFAKEPDFGKHQVRRGTLAMGSDTSAAVRLVWDPTAGKLYLDLNRNDDLTDDPVFENRVDKALAGTVQNFSGIEIASPRGPQYGLWTVDITLYVRDPTTYFGTARVRSGWEGEIELYGRKRVLSVLDNLDGVINDDDALALREAGKALQDTHLLPSSRTVRTPGNVMVFNIPTAGRRLFFDGHTYRMSFALEPGERGGVVVARIVEVPTPLGECKIAGQQITRLALIATGEPPMEPPTPAKIARQKPLIALLDNPAGTILIPVGNYDVQIVYLDSGTSLGVLTTNATALVSVSPNIPATLTLGAPLNNVVTVNRTGRALNLAYRLEGLGGEQYEAVQPPATRPSDPPRFLVYKNDRKVASGSFEYG